MLKELSWQEWTTMEAQALELWIWASEKFEQIDGLAHQIDVWSALFTMAEEGLEN